MTLSSQRRKLECDGLVLRQEAVNLRLNDPKPRHGRTLPIAPKS